MSERGTILIIDDEPVNIQALNAILSDHYVTRFATSAEQALDLLMRYSVDLILLDVIMPGMNGYELCRHIRDMPGLCDTPIIFVTSRNSAEDEERGLRAGAVDYIHKPFSPLVVRARVDTHFMLKTYRDRLARLSLVDSLTDLANRRQFDETFAHDWQLAVRTGRPLGLLMLDVDHFKQFNDHFGHPEGDACLKQVAGVLKAFARRPSDLACRIGGEEFAVLLPETDGDGARQVAEAIRRSIQALAIPHPKSSVEPVVTVSIGLVVAYIHHAQGSGENVIALADESLYAAKHDGRNCVGPTRQIGVAALNTAQGGAV